MLAVLWLYTSLITASLPTLTNKRICLLIAHPDDEAMFFGPSILALTRPELGNHVKILCLSSGNADGLGEVRRKELVKSGLLLGLRQPADVLILEDPRFQDSMTATWDKKEISNLLTTTFAPKMAKLSAKKEPETNIDVLITFDRGGVSSHPNHISLYHGAVAFVRSVMANHSGWDPAIKLYTLTSVNIFRKYISVLDAPVIIVKTLFQKKEGPPFPGPLLTVSGFKDYRKAQKAMVEAHESQMRWFRWGWIGVARYMVINDLKKEKIS
jgi:N-acetylglucosaminylphosphatidylinositol deacetylase